MVESAGQLNSALSPPKTHLGTSRAVFRRTELDLGLWGDLGAGSSPCLSWRTAGAALPLPSRVLIGVWTHAGNAGTFGLLRPAQAVDRRRRAARPGRPLEWVAASSVGACGVTVPAPDGSKRFGGRKCEGRQGLEPEG